MENLFETEDFEKYPGLHIAVNKLIDEWINKQTKRDLKNKKSVKSSTVILNKLTKKDLINSMLKKDRNYFFLHLLVGDIFYHLIKYGDPKRYDEIIETVKVVLMGRGK